MMKALRIIGVLAMAVVASLVFFSTAMAQDLSQQVVEVPNNNSAAWSALVGAWLPLIIAAIQRERWPSRQKGLFVFGACAVSAFGTSYFAGDFEGAELVFNVMATLSAATISYNMFWKPTDIAPSIERATG